MSEVLTGQPAVDGLLRVLDLEQIELNIFRGVGPQVSPQRVFGGQVAGQALVAAGRTVEAGRHVNSLHGYFVRPGDSTKPIVYEVERIRDGRSFSVRRTVAVQNGQTIFFMSASFHTGEDGLEHGETAPVDVPPPVEVPTLTERLASHPDRLGIWARIPRPIDVRYIGESGFAASGERHAATQQRVWMKVDGKLPDDPLLHVCVLTYASDLTLLDTVLNRHGQVWGPGGYAGASLDHALWFHRPFRADEWFLYDSASPSASRGRGLATGQFYTTDGRHIATTAQEGILRVTP
ncbi:acyl-CoA thioesterase [Stackebrandtia nassauensis]|uniref:Acyl-CoA thioesterase 2 n=1 Tax=Stackebrandtia nassauensis (strain DSM 44728 / CIP 108903 / NRRL B-16338 / NBRC 102104 / LLR-40K-21) TaxID=446470 RepID=D3PYM6_STANL|nr:acyl-CoA thioesterase II [Stackebrandtia nassauensis]ADD43459.1 Choloyl-CoA hydrolase [Stackebrandtia nassauensis DSM 44728]